MTPGKINWNNTDKKHMLSVMIAEERISRKRFLRMGEGRGRRAQGTEMVNAYYIHV